MSLTFTNEGIVLRPRPLRPATILWSHVEFICPTPFLVHGPAGWWPSNLSPGVMATLEKNGVQLDRQSLLLDLLIKDRQTLLASCAGLTRWWLGRQILRRGENGGVLSLRIDPSKLSGSLDNLMDLLASSSCLDLYSHGA